MVQDTYQSGVDICQYLQYSIHFFPFFSSIIFFIPFSLSFK